MMRRILAVAVIFILSSVYAHSGALEDGKALAEAGSIDKAAQKYKMACDGRNMEACGLLGEVYVKGGERTISPNLQKAASLYDKACKGKDAFSCNNLGKMYAKGEGVNRDNRRALDLFTKACNMDYKEACENGKSLAEFIKNTPASDTITIKRNVYINRNGSGRTYNLDKGGSDKAWGNKDNSSSK